MKIKSLTILLVAVISLGSVNISRADDSNCCASENDKSAAAVADVAVARPGCFLATLIGATVFVIALPVAALSGSVKKTAHTLVVCPAKATFTRPIGDFSSLE